MWVSTSMEPVLLVQSFHMLGLAWCSHSHAKLMKDELLCGEGLVPTKHEVQAVSCP